MQGSPSAKYCWCHITENDITSRNGAESIFGLLSCCCYVLLIAHQCCRPKNYKELFNLRHAQARNVVEQIFGVVKRRFRLLVVAPEYDLATQAKMVPAICVLHNFIQIHDVDDIPEIEDFWSRGQATGALMGLGGDISNAERNQATELRESIAKAMWASYQSIIDGRSQN
jgi:hypothetical protein